MNKHVAHHTHKVDRIRNHSLIERGTNGGVEDEDSRAPLTRPDRQGDIRGIDNHEINHIPIGTKGEVTKTAIVEVIIMVY